jgi:hypothetical protein
MCEWAAKNLRTAQCLHYAKGAAHEYQERRIWPCSDARKIGSSPEKWIVCENFVGKDGRDAQAGVDFGTTRNIPCPVCKTEEEAEAIYQRETKEALERYHAAIARAEREKEERIEESNIIIHYVSVLGVELMLWDDTDIRYRSAGGTLKSGRVVFL